MRKIEQEMWQCVCACLPFQKDNTSVSIHLGSPNIFLHGNHIASVKDGKVIVNVDTLRKWPTVTTLSRLRALGVNVYKRKGVVHLWGEPI